MEMINYNNGRKMKCNNGLGPQIEEKYTPLAEWFSKLNEERNEET